MIRSAKLTSKSFFTLLFKIFISVGLLYYLTINIDFEKLILQIRNANYFLVASAFLLVSLNIFLQFWRWEIISNKTLGESNRSKILLSLFYGYSAGLVTPLRLGEYIGRAIGFRENSITKVTLATIIDKFIPLLVIVFVGALFTILFGLKFFNLSIYTATAFFILEIAIIYFFYYSLFHTDFLKEYVLKKLLRFKWMEKHLEQFSAFKYLNRNTIFKLLAISFAGYSCYIFQFGLLTAAFIHNWDILNYCWIGILVMFVKSIIPPITFVDLGIREGASVFFAPYFGLPNAVGFNAAFFLFLFNILFPALIGLFFFLRRD